MRVRADLDLCQGHAMCGLEAPEVFAYDKDTNQVRVLDANPGEGRRDQVTKAVAYCPAMALSTEDE